MPYRSFYSPAGWPSSFYCLFYRLYSLFPNKTASSFLLIIHTKSTRAETCSQPSNSSASAQNKPKSTTPVAPNASSSRSRSPKAKANNPGRIQHTTTKASPTRQTPTTTNPKARSPCHQPTPRPQPPAPALGQGLALRAHPRKAAAATPAAAKHPTAKQKPT